MINTLETVVQFLEAELNKKLEVSTTSFASDYNKNDIKFGGVSNRTINGEDFMLGIERVPSQGVTLIDITINDVDYFARFKVETEAEKEIRVKAENRETYLAGDEIYEIQSDKNFTFDSYVFKNKDTYCPLKQGDKVRITTSFTSLNFDGGVVQHVKESGNSDLYLIVEASKYFENYEDYLADKKVRDEAAREAAKQALIQQKLDEAEADRRKAQERAEKAENGRLLALEYGAAELKGSPAQIAWANQIRADYICWMRDTKREDDIRLAFETTKFNTAKFWIDNKSNTKKAVDAKVDFDKLRKQAAKKQAA